MTKNHKTLKNNLTKPKYFFQYIGGIFLELIITDFLTQRTVAFATALLLSSNLAVRALEMTEISHIQIGNGEGYAEMIKYHSGSQSL